MRDTTTGREHPIEKFLDELTRRADQRADSELADLVILFRAVVAAEKETEREVVQLREDVELLKLAVRGAAYEPAPEPPADGEISFPPLPTTLFGIPVRLVNGHTTDDVRLAVETLLPPGLSAGEAVEELTQRGFVERREV